MVPPGVAKCLPLSSSRLVGGGRFPGFAAQPPHELGTGAAQDVATRGARRLFPRAPRFGSERTPGGVVSDIPDGPGALLVQAVGIALEDLHPVIGSERFLYADKEEKQARRAQCELQAGDAGLSNGDLGIVAGLIYHYFRGRAHSPSLKLLHHHAAGVCRPSRTEA